jgi:hypothetical protein
MTAKWLNFVLYFFAEYKNSRKNIIILWWKYVVDISSEALLNLFGNTQMKNCLQCDRAACKEDFLLGLVITNNKEEGTVQQYTRA